VERAVVTQVPGKVMDWKNLNVIIYNITKHI